ncbi:MAG TPA: biotin--[acetyl-CoA-carboxylase] ligase [Bacteroidales bacterium]|nr:biotin--[acetyl-CoA-carboxylase] ligase [Bacteroidales bacterium]
MIGTLHIKWFEETDSTNTQLQNDRHNLENLAVYAAYFQTAGRGQRGNRWESKRGENLTFSILFKPGNIAAQDQFVISKAVALGIVDYLAQRGVECRIKWPNDIYYNDLKICGILIENGISCDKLAYSIAGIGININQEKFDSNAPNPTSLKLITGKEYDIQQELPDIVCLIAGRYNQATTGKTNELEKDYLELLYRKGEYRNYIDCTTGDSFEARITGLDDQARLKVETRDGEIKVYAFKEIGYVI